MTRSCEYCVKLTRGKVKTKFKIEFKIKFKIKCAWPQSFEVEGSQKFL